MQHFIKGNEDKLDNNVQKTPKQKKNPTWVTFWGVYFFKDCRDKVDLSVLPLRKAIRKPERAQACAMPAGCTRKTKAFVGLNTKTCCIGLLICSDEAI